MECLPKITERVRLPLSIKVPPHVMDHRFQGKAVLPAVEAMEALAASSRAHLRETAAFAIGDARFDKFLFIEDDKTPIDAFNHLEVFQNGTVISRLITKTRSKKALITRTLKHATLCFRGVSNGCEPDPPMGMPTTFEQHVSAEAIYRSLVPFGPAYHNLRGGVALHKEGARGAVYAPSLGDPEGLLGSPFPLDAAFHAACVWGQRYVGYVGFPVGFGLRRLFVPTRSGNTYTASIIPKAIHPDRFLVDIWIGGTGGKRHEAVLGVVMKDVSGGRIKPPSWIAKQNANNPGLTREKETCRQ